MRVFALSLLYATAAALIMHDPLVTRVYALPASRARKVIASENDEPPLTSAERRKRLAEREAQLRANLLKSKRDFAELRARLEAATERSAALNDNLTTTDEALAAKKRLSNVEKRMVSIESSALGWLGISRRDSRQEHQTSPPPPPPPPPTDAKRLPPPPPPPLSDETEFAVARTDSSMQIPLPTGGDAPLMDAELATGLVVTAVGLALASQGKLPAWLRSLGVFMWDEVVPFATTVRASVHMVELT